MAFIAVSNTFTNGTTSDAGQVNTNFNDIIAGLSDGTKDIQVAAISCTTITATGDVTIGNSSADSLVVTSLVNSNFIPKMATAAYTLGDSSNQWQGLYLNNGATDGGAIYFDGGTTSYFKSNATGTIGTFGGFTELDMTSLKIKDSSLSKSSAPSANTMHLNSIVKAWAKLTAGAAGSVTVTDGFNINTASYSGADMTVNLHTAMANTNYAIFITNNDIGYTNRQYIAAPVSSSQFTIRCTDASGTGTSITSGEDIAILILGVQ